eukprot:CAMPEP_0171083154 /NCGR_PEP_ID=MMETSP0766_2-20121228/17546_1 /TAXON_ID=439317 /ORGANISM="Gambierdiscus australes, Strain CAWD 149" /LENGTH=34 /DNA_ID= /DNA_START= /DNA_END= /DNA_ORIENTATION=
MANASVKKTGVQVGCALPTAEAEANTSEWLLRAD